MFKIELAPETVEELGRIADGSGFGYVTDNGSDYDVHVTRKGHDLVLEVLAVNDIVLV